MSPCPALGLQICAFLTKHTCPFSERYALDTTNLPTKVHCVAINLKPFLVKTSPSDGSKVQTDSGISSYISFQLGSLTYMICAQFR